MKRFLLAAFGAASILGAGSASALVFTATGNGPITAYFYGQSAGYGSDLGLRINGVSTGIYGLYNHGTAPGTSLVLGNASMGDLLEFELRVSPSDNGFVNYSLYSNPSLNGDGEEHTVSSPFNAGTFGIPNGTFVGFEDIMPISGSDFDFNDHQFVFTGVTQTHRTPEGGATLVLGSLSMIGLGLIRRKVS